MDAEEVAIHVLGLENPGRPRLVEEGPEHRDENIEGDQFGDGDEAFPGAKELQQMTALMCHLKTSLGAKTGRSEVEIIAC